MPFPRREASVRGQGIPELDECFPRVLCRVGAVDAVVQMNLDLAPAGAAMLSEALNNSPLVLFRWKKVGVTEMPTISVSERRHRRRVVLAPCLKPFFLLVKTGVDVFSGTRDEGWFEMVCDRDDEMETVFFGWPPREVLPVNSGQPPKRTHTLGDLRSETR